MSLLIFIGVIVIGLGVWYVSVYAAVSLLNYLTRTPK